jgi:hypothetical protein
LLVLFLPYISLAFFPDPWVVRLLQAVYVHSEFRALLASNLEVQLALFLHHPIRVAAMRIKLPESDSFSGLLVQIDDISDLNYPMFILMIIIALVFAIGFLYVSPCYLIGQLEACLQML